MLEEIAPANCNVLSKFVPDTILLAERAGRRPRPALPMAKQAGLADQMLAVEKEDGNPAAGLALSGLVG